MAGGEASQPSGLDDAAEHWRFKCFIELGFPFDWATDLARARVDHWIVAKALAAGCSHDQAVRIFV